MMTVMLRPLRFASLVLFGLCLTIGTAQAQSVSATPASGPVRPVTLTTAGFTAPFYTQFQENGVLLGGCPDDPDVNKHANCTATVSLQNPSYGEHTINAFNSIGETAQTVYTVLPPSMSLSVPCPRPGADVNVEGSQFPPGLDAGIYFDNMLLASNNYPDSDGHFLRVIKIPQGASPGDHVVSVRNSIGANAEQHLLVSLTACTVPAAPPWAVVLTALALLSAFCRLRLPHTGVEAMSLRSASI